MTTAIDTNVLVALWDEDETRDSFVRSLLDAAFERGNVVIAAPVYTELLGFPSRTEEFLDRFFQDTGILVDWDLNEPIWRAAGGAFQRYAARRRRQGEPGPRRIMADFLIGAHALRHGFSLLTFDDRIYRAAFPQLVIVSA